jgi:hypothetical protein
LENKCYIQKIPFLATFILWTNPVLADGLGGMAEGIFLLYFSIFIAIYNTVNIVVLASTRPKEGMKLSRIISLFTYLCYFYTIGSLLIERLTTKNGSYAPLSVSHYLFLSYILVGFILTIYKTSKKIGDRRVKDS